MPILNLGVIFKINETISQDLQSLTWWPTVESIFCLININISMLKGLRVLQFEGLAPSVFCGLYFADNGAETIVVTRKEPAPFSMPIETNLMNRGKKCITLSTKSPQDLHLIKELIKISDVVIDPYRPRVLQKLGIGPEFMFQTNPRIVLLRVSGYGQTGAQSLRPGHDLNYISASGIVPLINKHSQSDMYQFPTNFLADFTSASLGITAALAALVVSRRTGVGRVVDCSLAQGAHYLAKTITQADQKQKPKTVRFVDRDGHSFCIEHWPQQQIEQKILNKAISQLLNSNSDTHQTQQFTITRVKPLSARAAQVAGLRNPFGTQPSSGVSLPSRNQDEAYVRGLVAGVCEPRAKL